MVAVLHVEVVPTALQPAVPMSHADGACGLIAGVPDGATGGAWLGFFFASAILRQSGRLLGQQLTGVHGWSLRCMCWALCFLLGPWQAETASTSTSMDGFLAGTFFSSAAVQFQRWWSGPACVQLSRNKFDSLQDSCGNCGHERLEETTTTTTIDLSFDSFWLWFRLASMLGFVLAGVIGAVCGYCCLRFSVQMICLSLALNSLWATGVSREAEKTAVVKAQVDFIKSRQAVVTY